MGIPSRGLWPLVGREEELAVLRRVWGTHGCRGLVICGPAGVGKTRLGEEFLGRTVRGGNIKGARVTASTAARTVPLGAMAHLISARVDLSDPVKGFAAVAAELAGSTGRRWAVLVDDLQLLDATSAMLLLQLLDTSVIRLIATVRTGEPVGDAVATLMHSNEMHRIDLTPLNQNQVEELMQAVLGGSVDRRTLHTLHRASEGNVLYLHELVQGALDAKTLTTDGKIWALAEGSLPSTPRLAELISARLKATEVHARPVLELLALCEPIALADVSAIASLDTLIGLEETGLIRTRQERRRVTVTLAHPLYGETLRASIPTLRRRTLLLEHAERVQAHGARRRADSLRLATWYLNATGTAAPELLIQGAELARHAHDHQQAIRLLQALPDHQQTFQSRLLLGDALFHSGASGEAEAVLAEADIEAVTEKEKLAVTMARIMALFWGGAHAVKAMAVNNAARADVFSPEGRRALQINEGAMRSVSGEPAKGLEILEAMEPDPEKAANISSWLQGAMTRTMGLAQTGRIDEALRWADQAYANHLRVDDQALYGHPAVQLHYKSVALAENGQLMQARDTGQRALDDLVSANVSMSQVRTSLFMARIEWLAGHPKTAQKWYIQSISVARSQNQFREMRLALAGVASSAALIGDLNTAQEALRDLSVYAPPGYLAGEDRLGEAWWHAASGRLDQARDVLYEAAELARNTGHVTSEALLLTDVARLGGAKEVVARLAELATICDGSFASARAHLAAALAASDPHELSSSASELDTIGADLLAAETAAQAAIAYLRLGDQRRATAAANQSALFASRCEGASSPLLAAPQAAAVLTKREREIALLAANGNSSKSIAEILHLSVRTVDNHLQHAYVKLGVTTRRELVARLRAVS